MKLMIQCKICGTPLGKEPTHPELETHWKKHHSWHWGKNKEKTPEDALIKKGKKFLNKLFTHDRGNCLKENLSYLFLL